MKKLSLLVGALGGTLAGYVFSNQKLREQLSKAKDAEAAAKVLGSHLSRDGKKIAKEVQAFVQSDEVQKNLSKAKKFAEDQFSVAKREVAALMESGAKSATTAAKKGIKDVKKKVKHMKVRVRSVS